MNNHGVLELLREEKIGARIQNQPFKNIQKEKTISKAAKGILTNYAEEMAGDYIPKSDLSERKSRGRFFTQKEIGLFMVGMFDINKLSFNILGSGAGIGMLSAAFCERATNSQSVVKPRDLRSNDKEVLNLKKSFKQKFSNGYLMTRGEPSADDD